MARLRLLFAAAAYLARQPFERSADRWAVANARLGQVPSGPALRLPTRLVGQAERGEAACQGQLTLAGRPLVITGGQPWEARLAHPAMAHALHGFTWLDDLAALGNGPARLTAQAWVGHWLERFGTGKGQGWTPALAGARLIRLSSHIRLLTRRQSPEARRAMMEAVARHVGYVTARADTARDPQDQIAALSGLIHGLLVLGGRETALADAIRGLGRAAADAVDEQSGGTPNRAPETLLEVIDYLVSAANALSAAGRPVDDRARTAIETGAQTLRGVRLTGSRLARFNGGGPGPDGKLDQVLAASGVRPARIPPPLAMGFGRLAGGTTALVIDGARPPRSNQTGEAHAGTLAMELSVGAQPLVVNGGPAQHLEADWRRAARTSAFHSTLVLDRSSSSRFWSPGLVTRAFGELMTDGPRAVRLERARDITGSWLNASHDGYSGTHGLLHDRKIFISADGSAIYGEDSVRLAENGGKQRFDARLKGLRGLGALAILHFHIHPDVDLRDPRDEALIRFYLADGAVWVLRHQGAEAAVEPAQYFDPDQGKPRSSQQVQLRTQIRKGTEVISWSLTRERAGQRTRRSTVATRPVEHTA
ncbi:MAG: heparinase II/III family protein [Pseudomonadota bacterium]